MIILAFKDGHDPAAAILKDGEVLAAVEEERFNRIKHAPAMFPEQAIRFCLESTGIKESEVDHLIYARKKNFKTALAVKLYYLSHPPKNKAQLRYALSHIKAQAKGVLKEFFGKARYQKVRKLFPGLPKKILSFDHHLMHAASAYYFSPFTEATIVTWDGKGEATSVLVAHGKGEQIKVLKRKGIFSSLGLFYSAVTKYLGFTPNDGEYKVMGLAPYGNPKAVSFDKVLKAQKGFNYYINSNAALYPLAKSGLEKLFGKARGKDEKLAQKHYDIAAAAQEVLERVGVEFTKAAIELTGSKNLCIAGGVGLNIKMNKLLKDSEFVDELFVQPASGDDGLVLGAVAHQYARLTGKRVKPLKTLYLGPEFSDEEIEQELKKSTLEYKKSNDIVSDVATLVADGKVVGWFQGKMEFGPRALGSRSILADPRKKEMKDEVNMKIKFREGFRPFCPSMISEKAPELLKNYTYAPYMVTAFDIKDESAANLIPAVVHVDNTVRPQAVEKELSPKYYSLIKAFDEKTGVPVLLNTSMNVRGEPIVCTPLDALNFFRKTHVDALAIGNFLLKKEGENMNKLDLLTEETLNTKY